ncbi:hypothetical protein C4D60_Mb06t25350 [Musa balbisiana]|uniref:RBR-type E3 ubiquitin transferase n=1 Tax=Musa balbisiana TaxID=52838 RepID=A0A4S8IQL4_MUSBA|nr:hypothetical protein C4D60_Mb06t25350 [Musa balbisiana]
MAEDEDCPSSSDVEEDDCYITDQEDAIEENVLQGLEDGREEDCHWSLSSVITKESLLAAQKEDLRKVMELLVLKEQHARTLLIHYRWDVERIFELLDQKGRERLFSEAGVTIVENKGLSASSSSGTCNVCFESFPPSAVTEMDCGHSWTEHFIVKINDGQSRRIRCMAPKCSAVCDEAVIRNLVSAKHPDIADRFDRFLLESYIEDNNKVKWCPSVPHCGNAIRVEGDIYCEVECTCGIQFCFSCLSEAHSPCSCLMWELWTKKCQDESETVNWITVNTKPCPKCHKPVEKNVGYVVVLLEEIIHGLASVVTVVVASKTTKQRGPSVQDVTFTVICTIIIDSLKQESNLKETIQGKISISENKESKIKDYTWVINGLNRLFRSRRVLSYSYPFAFYMFGDELFKDEMTPQERDMKQNLFEDQQQQLEANVEKLSMFLEKDFQHFSDDEVMDIMRHVINLSNVVDRLCKQMYQCIENDLLYPLQRATHNIAPYKSKGLERASELSVCWDSDQSLTSTKTRVAVPSKHASSSSDESGCSSRKRARTEAQGAAPLFDLNMPAEVIDKS